MAVSPLSFILFVRMDWSPVSFRSNSCSLALFCSSNSYISSATIRVALRNMGVWCASPLSVGTLLVLLFSVLLMTAR